MKKSYDDLDELKRNLEKLVENARKLNGKKVPIEDLLNPDFMKKHTVFSSFDEMCDASVREYGEKIARDLVDDK